MSKFKVGDRVKCIDSGTKGVGWELNRTGTIKSFTNGNDIAWFHEPSFNGYGVWCDSLELVEDEPILNETITATEVRYGTGTVDTNTYSYDEPISLWKAIYGMGMDNINSNAQQEQPNNNMNNGLISKMKDLLMSEPKKTLLKYNIIDREENLTNEGKELFINFMFEQNKDKFIDEVVSVFVKAEEKESKKK